MSRFELDIDRQDDITSHVPTTLPPQAVPLGQDGPVPPLPVVPAVPVPAVPVLELPPVPDGLSPPGVQAAEIVATAIAKAMTAVWNFMKTSPSREIKVLNYSRPA
jgi:hypothetical protein